MPEKSSKSRATGAQAKATSNDNSLTTTIYFKWTNPVVDLDNDTNKVYSWTIIYPRQPGGPEQTSCEIDNTLVTELDEFIIGMFGMMGQKPNSPLIKRKQITEIYIAQCRGLVETAIDKWVKVHGV